MSWYCAVQHQQRAFTCTPSSTPSFSPHTSAMYAPLQLHLPRLGDCFPSCSRLTFVEDLRQCALVVSTLRLSSLRLREPRPSLRAREQSPGCGRGRRSRLSTACRRGCPLVSQRWFRWVEDCENSGGAANGAEAECGGQPRGPSGGGEVAVRAVSREERCQAPVSWMRVKMAEGLLETDIRASFVCMVGDNSCLQTSVQ